MSEKLFDIEIITPRKVAYQGKAQSFTAPGVMGSFQVLYNHAPMVAAFEIGEIRILDSNNTEHHYATSGGIVHIVQNKVTVLAETIESPKEIDVARAQAAQERAQQRLQARSSDIDIDRAQFALKRAINRLRIVERYL